MRQSRGIHFSMQILNSSVFTLRYGRRQCKELEDTGARRANMRVEMSNVIVYAICVIAQ